jgi:hypothetical protein
MPTNEIKVRNPWAAWLGLPLITLGIYHLVWYYKIHKEMSLATKNPEAPVVGPLLVLILLNWTMVAPFVSYYRTGNRIRSAQRAAGVPDDCNPLVGMLLMLLAGAGAYYYQMQLNRIPSSTLVTT